MNPWARWLASSPWQALALMGALTLVALAGIVDPLTGAARLRIDPSLNELLPDDDEGRQSYEALRDRFGSDDTLVLALEADDLFTNSVLHQVVRLTRRLEGLDGVRSVRSLANAPHLRVVDGEIESEPFLGRIPGDPAQIAALREEVMADRIHGGSLVSRDGRMASVVVQLDDISELEFIERQLDRRVVEAARAEATSGVIWMAGTPHVKAEMSRILTADLAFMLPAILLLMVGLSALFFRSGAGAWVPVTTSLLGLTWTLGVMGWTGHALNIITTIIPPLVLIVGFAYVIHVVAEHRAQLREPCAESDPGLRHRLGVARTVERVALPVLLTGVTTAVGFLSLMANSLHVIREFGLFAAVGVLASLVASLGFAPAVLAVSAPPSTIGVEKRERRLDGWVEGLARFDLRHRWWVLSAGAVVFVGSLLAIPMIVVSTEIIENFEPDASIRRSYEAINAGLEGANTLYVTVDGGTRGAFKEPELLGRVESLQRWLGEQPEIGGSTSLVDHVMTLHQAFRDGAVEERRIPESRHTVAQLLFIGAGDELRRYVDAAYQNASVVVRSTSTESSEIGRLADRIELRMASLGLDGGVTGNAVLLSQASDDISRGQAWSLSVAFLGIYGILALYFRSPRLGLIALLPNALPVAVYFGALGVTGITLSNATALMGCIVLGIAVDDTIHFMVQFRRFARRLGCESEGAVRALATVGRPVTLTTVVLCVGLLVVTTSDLRTQAQFGALGAFTLAVAWLVDVVVTPALCSVMKVVDRDTVRWRPEAGV